MMTAQQQPTSSAEQLGEKIRRARVQRQLTHRDLADRCGTQLDAVRAWERGELVPTPREWSKLVAMVHRGLKSEAMLWRDARARLTSPRDADVDMDKARRYVESSAHDPEADAADAVVPELPRPEDAVTLGEAIRRARIIEGLRQEELAQLVGVGDSAVSSWELGHITPVRENFDKLVQLIPCIEKWRDETQDRPKPLGSKTGTSNMGHAPGFSNTPRLVTVPFSVPIVVAEKEIMQAKMKTLDELGIELARSMLTAAHSERVLDELSKAMEIERDLLTRAHARVEEVQRELHDAVSRASRKS